MVKHIMVRKVYEPKGHPPQFSAPVEITFLHTLLPDKMKRKAGPLATQIIAENLTTIRIDENHRIDVVSMEDLG